jgi:hypothetical protein
MDYYGLAELFPKGHVLSVQYQEVVETLGGGA